MPLAGIFYFAGNEGFGLFLLTRKTWLSVQKNSFWKGSDRIRPVGSSLFLQTAPWPIAPAMSKTRSFGSAAMARKHRCLLNAASICGLVSLRTERAFWYLMILVSSLWTPTAVIHSRLSTRLLDPLSGRQMGKKWRIFNTIQVCSSCLPTAALLPISCYPRLVFTFVIPGRRMG